MRPPFSACGGRCEAKTLPPFPHNLVWLAPFPSFPSFPHPQLPVFFVHRLLLFVILFFWGPRLFGLSFFFLLFCFSILFCLCSFLCHSLFRPLSLNVLSYYPYSLANFLSPSLVLYCQDYSCWYGCRCYGDSA